MVDISKIGKFGKSMENTGKWMKRMRNPTRCKYHNNSYTLYTEFERFILYYIVNKIIKF